VYWVIEATSPTKAELFGDFSECLLDVWTSRYDSIERGPDQVIRRPLGRVYARLIGTGAICARQDEGKTILGR
jgi:hypothetical protein